MDASPSALHEAVATMLQAHRAAREALAEERTRDPNFPAEYTRRRLDLCLDTIEDALTELRDTLA